MKRIINHFVNEIKVGFILERRYWLESLFSYLIVISMFMGLFFGIGQFVETSEGGLDVLIVGAVIWIFANACYGSASSDIAEEIRNGTFEQLCILPNQLWYVLMIRGMVGILFSSLFFMPLLLVFMSLTGRWLDIDYVTLFSALILAAPSLIGVGYFVGGLSLVFKKVSSLQSIVYFVLIAIIAMPGYPINFLSALPFLLGASVAKLTVNHQAVLGITEVSYIILNSLFYFFLGLKFFKYMENLARKKGTLSHY